MTVIAVRLEINEWPARTAARLTTDVCAALFVQPDTELFHTTSHVVKTVYEVAGNARYFLQEHEGEARINIDSYGLLFDSVSGELIISQYIPGSVEHDRWVTSRTFGSYRCFNAAPGDDRSEVTRAAAYLLSQQSGVALSDLWDGSEESAKQLSERILRGRSLTLPIEMVLELAAEELESAGLLLRRPLGRTLVNGYQDHVFELRENFNDPLRVEGTEE